MKSNKSVKAMMVSVEFDNQFYPKNRFKLLRWEWFKSGFVFYVADLMAAEEYEIQASPYYDTVSLDSNGNIQAVSKG